MLCAASCDIGACQARVDTVSANHLTDVFIDAIEIEHQHIRDIQALRPHGVDRAAERRRHLSNAIEFSRIIRTNMDVSVRNQNILAHFDATLPRETSEVFLAVSRSTVSRACTHVIIYS